MSVLSLPRIHFTGKASANPSTANNQAIALWADVAKIKLLPPAGVDTPDQLMQWLQTVIKTYEEPFGKGTQMRAYWNHYGDHQFLFDGVTVQSVQCQPGELSDADPLIGAGIQLHGNEYKDQPTGAVMVDLDPTTGVTTQLFSAQVALVDAQGASLVSAKGKYKASLRLMCYPRNLDKTICGTSPSIAASAVFQFGIPNEDLQYDAQALASSAGLQALKAAGSKGQGLLIRFCLYYFQHPYTAEEVKGKIERGENPSNAAQGQVVGTIGPWEAEEPQNVPVGRYLYGPRPSWNFSTSGDHAPPLPKEGNTPPSKAALWPAVAKVSRETRTLSLDFITTVPENGASLEKADLGTLVLWGYATEGPLDAGDTPQGALIAELPYSAYDRRAYERTGGIIDVPLRSEELLALAESGRLALFQQSALTSATAPAREYDCPLARNAVLLELNYSVVEVEVDRALYVDQGQNLQVTVRAWLKGRPDPGRNIVLTQSASSVSAPEPPEEYPKRNLEETGPEKVVPRVDIPSSGTTDEQGRLSFTLRGNEPGFAYIEFRPDNCPQESVPEDWSQKFYFYVRVLPKDDYSQTPAPISWDFIFKEVFAYYYLCYPAMNSYIDFSSRVETESAALFIERFTSAEYLQSTLYMPVTRELSAGKRSLIARWCQQILQEGRL